MFKKYRRILIPAAIVLGLVLIFWLIGKIRGGNEETLSTKVKKGDFKISVTTTGELEAKSSEKIYGPAGLRRIGIWQVKIENIVPEGTVVDSGSVVAGLDRTEISSKLKDLQTNLEKLESQFTKTKLDTSLELRNARDELINMDYSMQEAKITLEQSKYEPPATIRQVSMDLEKQERNYSQAQKNYKLKLEKARANMQEVAATLQQAQRQFDDMNQVVDEFTVKAPKRGMVIYRRNWDGAKQGVGSTLSAWDNTVATLPDLTEMISKTYINEIDISKIKVGQAVDVGIDAFPEKKFTGIVTEVANIGEQMRSSNAKVFEVKIKVKEFDSILRPSMTTKNAIITSVVKNVIYVPIECIHTEDSLTFVYKKDGRRITKQEVEVGQSNENEIIIKNGILVDDEVLPNIPDKPENLSVVRLEKKEKILKRYLYTFNISIEAVILNKFRSMLTALGIIFGVAAVISMMAIGSGAKKEILDQIKLVGVNNIILKPKIKNQDKKSSSSDQNAKDNQSMVKDKYSPGLTLKDAESIKSIIPSVSKVSPEVDYDTYILKDGVRSPAKLSGVTPDFFEVFNLKLSNGLMFNTEQLKMGKSVCIIGPIVKTKFFKQQDPIGQYIKCGNIWLMVIGVLENRNVTKDATENLDISDYNNMIYAPIQTLLLRFKNRSLVTSDQLSDGENSDDEEVYTSSEGGGADNRNELDKIIVQVKESPQMDATTQLLKRMIQRRHSGVEDFEIKIPEQLLKQEQRTKDIFNIVLGVIAGISLLVGGIGIMNIMLASVMERTKEIGIRMAIGATRRDIVIQFLMEATIISLSGGITGIILGVILSKLITQVTGILTIISLISVVVSFGVAATVGITFGYMPAKRAASADPVESLRYE